MKLYEKIINFGNKENLHSSKKIMEGKNKMKKKLTSFILAGLLFIGLVTAVLVHFGEITTTADVNQAVILSGDDEVVTVSGGESIVSGEEYNILSQTSVNVPVILESSSYEGVETFYVKELVLENKDPTTWTIIEDDRIANLYYSFIGEYFGYKLVAEDLEPNTEYSLVYYIDISANKEWNLANSIEVATGTTNENGIFTDFHGSVTLPEGLPYGIDYNGNPDEGDSYCNFENGFDDYEHCSGAKFWVMPSTDFDSVAWNPNAWLFETDLIEYDNNDDFVIYPEDSLYFKLLNIFDFSAVGEYVIETTLNIFEE